MEVIALKLITGEDVLGELESRDEDSLVIVNPVGIAVVRGKDGQPNVGFTPFPIHGEQKTGVTIAFARAVAFSISFDAPFDGSWKINSSAARPPSEYAN